MGTIAYDQIFTSSIPNNEGVEVIKVKEMLPLYKNGVEAERIELIGFESNDFKVVSQKGLYRVGDKTVYIKPDYNLKEGIELTRSFVESGYLGSNNRIRAKRFNFSLTPDSKDPVYSEGILIPFSDYVDYCESKKLVYLNLGDNLGVYKHQSDQADQADQSKGINVSGKKGYWPENLKKTDEDNYKSVKKYLNYPLDTFITRKYDGSSISVGWIDGKPFIGSRNYERPIYTKKIVGQRSKTTWERFLSIFGKKIDLNIYKEEFNQEDDFVVTAFPYLEKIKTTFGNNVVLQGELIGGKSKGSGNKNNPDSWGDLRIVFFGGQIINKYNSEKLPPDFLMEYDEFNTVDLIIWRVFDSPEEFENFCDNYFKSYNIEGVVVTHFGFNQKVNGSFKYLNPEYDSKK